MDDGRTWKSASGACGDCDTWYGDLYAMNRILRLSPRNRGSKGDFDLFVETGNKAPDAGKSPVDVPYLSGMRDFAISFKTLNGSRPVVQSRPSETPPAKGDYVVIWQQNQTTRVLMRAHDSIDKSASNSGFARVGPAFTAAMSDVNVVQVAGGHTQPVYFLGDGTGIWSGETTNRGAVARWNQIVPSADGSATVARRFFVDPWNPDLLYLIADNEVLASTTRGRTWIPEQGLAGAISANNTWEYTNCSNHQCLLNDIAFDPTHRTRRFAAGLAGVFFTADGSDWFRLLDTRALPGRPLSLWFDPLSDPEDATLFVACLGRGIVRLHPIPDRAPQRLQRIANGGFELGRAGWRFPSSAWLDGTVTRNGEQSAALGFDHDSTGVMSQSFRVPCETEGAVLGFWWYMKTEEGREPGDAMKVFLESEHGITLLMEATTALSPRDIWSRAEFSLGGLGCGGMTLRFEANSNHDRPTTFYIDDVELVLPGE